MSSYDDVHREALHDWLDQRDLEHEPPDCGPDRESRGPDREPPEPQAAAHRYQATPAERRRAAGREGSTVKQTNPKVTRARRDRQDPLGPARGIMIGALLGSLVWIAIGLIIWQVTQ